MTEKIEITSTRLINDIRSNIVLTMLSMDKEYQILNKKVYIPFGFSLAKEYFRLFGKSFNKEDFAERDWCIWSKDDTHHNLIGYRENEYEELAYFYRNSFAIPSLRGDYWNRSTSVSCSNDNQYLLLNRLIPTFRGSSNVVGADFAHTGPNGYETLGITVESNNCKLLNSRLPNISESDDIIYKVSYDNNDHKVFIENFLNTKSLKDFIQIFSFCKSIVSKTNNNISSNQYHRDLRTYKGEDAQNMLFSIEKSNELSSQILEVFDMHNLYNIKNISRDKSKKEGITLSEVSKITDFTLLEKKMDLDDLEKERQLVNKNLESINEKINELRNYIKNSERKKESSSQGKLERQIRNSQGFSEAKLKKLLTKYLNYETK